MLTRSELRTLLLVAVAGTIVLFGEIVAIGVALGGASLRAVIFWLVAAAVSAVALVAYGSATPGATRRLVEAAAAGAGAYLVFHLVNYEGLSGVTFASAYGAATGVGTALALPRRTTVRLIARLTAVAASAALVITLEANTTVEDLGYFFPGFAVAAAGIADVVVGTYAQRRLLVAVALAVVPAALLVGVVVFEDREAERHIHEQRVAAQPAPAVVGRERIAWTFPARGFNSGPLVAGDVVVADAYDALYGVDAETGNERWRMLLAGRDGLTLPVAHRNTLFFPANLAGMHAIDVSSGRRRWHFGPKNVQMWGVVAHRDGLVVGTSAPSGTTALYGLDSETGRRRWRLVPEGEVVELAVHPAGARFETRRGRFLVDVRTGRVAPTGAVPAAKYTYGDVAALRSRRRGWLYRAGWEADTSEPLELDGEVFVNIGLAMPKRNGGLYVLDERTGRLRWRVEIAGDSEFKPAARGELVYVTSTSACADLGGCRSGLYAIRRG